MYECVLCFVSKISLEKTENCRVAALIFELKRQRILVLLRDNCEFWICLRNLARNESCLCFVDVINLSELLFLGVQSHVRLYVSSHEPQVKSEESKVRRSVKCWESRVKCV